MNKVQMYSLIASIYTKTENAVSVDDLDKYLLKFAVAQICEKNSVHREDVIQMIEVMPSISRVASELTGRHLVQMINDGVSLFEMLFLIDAEGSII